MQKNVAVTMMQRQCQMWP